MKKLKFYLTDDIGPEHIVLMQKEIMEGEFKIKVSDGSVMSLHDIFLKTEATCIIVEDFMFSFNKEDYGWSLKKR